MKTTFNAKPFLYIFVRVLLSSAVIIVFIFGVSLLIESVALMVIISIPFIVLMCLCTSLIIFRHSNDLINIPLKRVLESAAILQIASQTIAENAKGLSQNTYILNDVACSLDEFAQTCDTALKGEGSSPPSQK